MKVSVDDFNVGHIVVDEKRTVFFGNDYICEHLGWINEELNHMPLSGLFTKASTIFIDSYVYPLLMNNGSVEELQLTMLSATGDRFPVVANIRTNKKKTFWTFFSCVNRDKLYQELILAKDLLEEQRVELLKLSTQDPLTGLANRRELQRRASQILLSAVDKNVSVAVVVIDIDHFKRINDTHGHAFGDEILKKLSKKLLENRSSHDVVARFGGEEFVLVLPNIEVSSIFDEIDSLRSNIENESMNQISITVSIGISLFQSHQTSVFDDLFMAADRALYTAKKQGRNRTVLSPLR